jgi:hypothetical protein
MVATNIRQKKTLKIFFIFIVENWESPLVPPLEKGGWRNLKVIGKGDGLPNRMVFDRQG